MKNYFTLLTMMWMVSTICTFVWIFTSGGSWLWPVFFAVGVIVVLYRYGKYLEREELKKDG